MKLKSNSQKAFTIVELLIVIVVIGILAAISIVAYNGIQDRARNVQVKESAHQLVLKIETQAAIKGSLPLYSDILGGLDGSNDPAEAAIPREIIDLVCAANVNDSSENKIQVIMNTKGTPPNHKCIAINYYQKGTTNGRRTIGECN